MLAILFNNLSFFKSTVSDAIRKLEITFLSVQFIKLKFN